MIDVGGPSMLRGAAKNFAHVAPVCRPERYGFVLDELRRNGTLSLETRRELAAETFATSAAYEAAIATWFSRARDVPRHARDRAREGRSTSPTGRTRTSAPRTTPSAAARTHLLSRVEQLHGKALSFNNLNDLSAARMLAREFALPACVIVKHANPCGVAHRRDDRGGVREGARLRPDVGLRRHRRAQPRGRRRARRAAGGAVHRGSLRARLRRRARSRRCGRSRTSGSSSTTSGAHDVDARNYKRVLGGLLVQDPDTDIDDREGWQVVTGTPSEQQLGDLVFAWRVCKHVPRTRS